VSSNTGARVLGDEEVDALPRRAERALGERKRSLDMGITGAFGRDRARAGVMPERAMGS